MTEDSKLFIPHSYSSIDKATRSMGFTMASDKLTCSLLRTLAMSKPSSSFLELGTGTGLSTSWILDGMDEHSTMVSVDNDEAVLNIANAFLGHDKRLDLILSDGEQWINNNKGNKFDYIFADTWHGKYLMLPEVLEMLNSGGFYIVDDMLPQPNWPQGHEEKAKRLLTYLENRDDLSVTRLNWSTGVVVAVKKYTSTRSY